MITITHLGDWPDANMPTTTYHVLHVDDAHVMLESGSIAVYYRPDTLEPVRLFRGGESCMPRKGTARRRLLDDLVLAIIAAAKLTDEKVHEHLTFKGIFTD